MNERIQNYFQGVKQLFICQVKEWAEIITDFETKNKYEVLDETGTKKGFIAEHGGGFLGVILRLILRTHRSMLIHFYNGNREVIFTAKRPFHFIWSDLNVMDETGRVIGHAYRRFGFLVMKKYDLTDSRGTIFARISSPLWRLWTFPVYDKNDSKIGAISKNWGGVLKEAFTDADKFQVQFPDNWTEEQKAILYATAISIDMDYFEANSSSVFGALSE